MTNKRLRWLLIGLLGLLFVALVTSTYEANSLFESQASKLIILKAKSLALASEQQSLIQAKKDIATYSNLEKIAKSVVPQDKDQAEAVREIVNIAASYSVSLSTVSFPASTLGSYVDPVVASTIKSSGSSLSQLTPVKNISGVYQLQITVVGDPTKPVAYDKFISFLSALEHNRRTAQVISIAIQPNTANRSLLTFSLILNEYIKP